MQECGSPSSLYLGGKSFLEPYLKKILYLMANANHKEARKVNGKSFWESTCYVLGPVLSVKKVVNKTCVVSVWSVDPHLESTAAVLNPGSFKSMDPPRPIG